MKHQIVAADVLEALTAHDLGGLFDGVFSDPPYGLGFMGKGWDHGVPSADTWGALLPHLRPGGNVALFGGTRTYHRLTCAVEDAGFEIRDSVACWMYGSGWPKPADVRKFIDRKLEAGTAGAARFAGWHANLKPAWEPCILARKPLDGGLANNALEHGVAGLNVDGCRIGATKRVPGGKVSQTGNSFYGSASMRTEQEGGRDPTAGRWPTNAILACEDALCGPGDPREIDHDPRCHVAVLDGQGGVTISSARTRRNTATGHTASAAYGCSAADYTSQGHDDSGGASRFFYVAKVSSAERGNSAHPCMKPLDLCTHIAHLLLPPAAR